MQFIIENKAVILGVLLAISEGLALVPSFKSSGVFDFIYRGIRTLAGKPVVDKA